MHSLTLENTQVLPDYGMASRLKVQLCDLPRLPLGKLKSTEVVVEVHAASVNPTDCKQRKGLLSQIWPLSLPCILGHIALLSVFTAPQSNCNRQH